MHRWIDAHARRVGDAAQGALLALVLLGGQAVLAQGAPVCVPYQATYSSGWYGKAQGFSPEEVCQQVIAQTSNPVLVSGGRAVYYSYVGVVQTAPRGWHCTFHGKVTLASTGEHIPAESGDYNWDGVGKKDCPLKITITGPTQALPLNAGGQKLRLVATVTEQNGEPRPDASISLWGQGGAGGFVTVVSNQNGVMQVDYTPPASMSSGSAQDKLRAECGGCENSAQHVIVVNGMTPQADEEAADDAGTCTAHPIRPMTGSKVYNHTDLQDGGAHSLDLTRHYASRWLIQPQSGLGAQNSHWAHNHAHRLVTVGRVTMVQNGQGSTSRFINVAPGYSVDPAIGGGSWSCPPQQWCTPPYTPPPQQPPAQWVAQGGSDTLVETAAGLELRRASDDSVWLYDKTSGRVLSHRQRNGWTYQYSYTGGLLTQVTNAFGRSMTLAYDAQGRLVTATGPGGQVAYGYDAAGRLAVATRSDGSSRQYLYEDSRWPQAITAVVNEAGVRWNKVAYDAQGRAILSELAGGANRTSISYGASSAAITDALNMTRSYQYQMTPGRGLRTTQASAPEGGNSVAGQSLDINGLVQSQTDYLGITTLFTWDSTRRLKTAETKAASRPEAQTTQTQWHPTFRLPVLVSEAGRTTAYTYDERGNKLTETQTDTATGQARSWAWTYNAQGLNTTHTDAAGQVWAYTYDSQGNRTAVRDPLGFETTYTYDAAGRVLTQTSPNRAPLAWTYDARGRVISQTSGADSVVYSYTPAGQIAGMVQSDGLQVTYQYDAAQRLTSASDNRGNSVQYTLDAMGNRTREEVRDATGAIALVTARTINNLNKVAALQGAAGQTTQLGYDANGEPISQTDPLNQTTRQTLDGLRRSTATTFADNTAATQAWNALDQLTQLTDPKGVATQYTYNAFGEVLTETSPDIGTLRYTRDSAGRVTRTEDARGQITQITRDALGRPTEIRYATDHVVSYQYNGAGDITRIDDKSGSTAYEHDPQGRITRKTQDVNDNPANPARFTTAYSYQNGRLSAITYPSGFKVSYSRSAGRITGISVQAPGRNKPVQPFVTDLSHTALGQPRAWNWSNGDAANRTFDPDGRMTGNEFASYIYDAASRITGITQHLWASSTATGTVTTYTTPLSWTVGYDSRNRLTSFNRAGAETAYTYDANSNRLTAIDKTTSDTDLDGDFDNADFSKTTSQNLTIEGTSNRLLGFTQTLTNVRGTRTVSTANTNVAYAVDAAGNLTSDGLRTFEYDAANRLSKARIFKDGEEASIRYLHNAIGQRVFKGEPTASQTLPSEADLGTSFIDWLKKNFRWLYANAQANTSIGTAYVYGDGEIPSWALLGEYDNGSAKGAGRSEFIWLPTEDGSAIPVGMFRNGKLFAIHSDYLGTPRLMTNELNQPVWQWPYSAFGNNKPTGILKAAPNPRAAITNVPVLLKATAATEMGLRMPGQVDDPETGTLQNIWRSYWAAHGRYTQADPIGLEGGLNIFIYVDADPLSFFDAEGFSKNKPLPKTSPLSPIPGGGGRALPKDGTFRPVTLPPPLAPTQPPVGKFCESPSQSEVWKQMTNYRDGIRTNGESGKKKEFYKWDHTHGDIEVYDRYGNHLGSMNPTTGQMHKPAVPGRTLW